jgi:putative DNA primase/helicase
MGWVSADKHQKKHRASCKAMHKVTPPVERKKTVARHGLVVTRAADLTPQKLSRVWNGRFVLGKTGIIAGEPGLGKSLIAAYMTATVSTGGKWWGDEGKARRGDVIYISAEDGAADTIRPRLEAAGARLDRVHVIEQVNDYCGSRPFNLLTDLGQLDQVLQGLRKPRLLIIDPLNACLSPPDNYRFNPNSVTQVRALLGRLEALAVKHRVAVVCVSHLTKAKSGSPLARMTGSFAFGAAARSVFTVTRKQDDPNQRVFAPAKNNLGADDNPLAFRIEQRLTAGKILAPCAVFASGAH